ncbi:fadA5 [Symbiodinium necroappetens]|uniref:FadA5 protein n=1 Tax=Symbiodinium necroappetens TaxID=1628268 RepID=A0A813CJN0_9DINO|nr:fadA5 [Symbiodinium necroappetens]
MTDFKPFTAYIVDACRTAGGKRNGRLSGYHPAELGATVCDALIERTNVKAAEVEDVIFGCVSQVGAQSGNIGRGVVLSSRHLPESVPGQSVDRQCGSSQQAIHAAAQAVMSGVHDCCIAGGVEVMSQVPIGASIIDGLKAGHGNPMSDATMEKYAEKMKAFEQFNMSSQAFSQFGGAELLAKKYGLSREDVDKFAAISQQRAVTSTQAGKFADEIVPLPVRRKEGQSEGMHTQDEGIREGVTVESVAKLKAMFPNGVLTPASSSQICDGAAAVLICNERGLAKLGVQPLARIHSLALAAADPVIMLEAPIPATQKALQKANMKIQDVDVYEVNEAFASVPLAWCKALGADFQKLNVNGGAMALGHPLGGTGAKLMTTLVHELRRRQGRFGLLAICEGGGTANATIASALRVKTMQLEAGSYTDVAQIDMFMCMCAGYGAPAETPVDKQVPPAKAKTGLSDPKAPTLLQKQSRREVHIDKTTTIPLELYWELIRAGERAKERGQHQLTKGTRHVGMHLIMST